MNKIGKRAQLFGVLILAVLLAGCGASGIASDDGDREPYGVDTPNFSDMADPDNASAEADELLPGLSDETVTSRWQLLNTHVKTLANHSYVLEETTRVQYENGTVAYEDTFTIRADTNGQTVAKHEHGARDWWATEDEVLLRTQYGNETHIEDTWYERRNPDNYQFTGFHTMEQGLTAVENITVTVEESDDAVRYVLESTDSPQTGHQNVSLQMVVTEMGYVESYRFEYEELRGRETAMVISEVTVERVGDSTITVEQPDWVSDANEYFEDWDNSSADE